VPAKKSSVIQDSIVVENRTYQIVISNTTMMSSLRINVVNEIATMLKTSFSNRARAIS